MAPENETVEKGDPYLESIIPFRGPAPLGVYPPERLSGGSHQPLQTGCCPKASKRRLLLHAARPGLWGRGAGVMRIFPHPFRCKEYGTTQRYDYRWWKLQTFFFGNFHPQKFWGRFSLILTHYAYFFKGVVGKKPPTWWWFKFFQVWIQDVNLSIFVCWPLIQVLIGFRNSTQGQYNAESLRLQGRVDFLGSLSDLTGSFRQHVSCVHLWFVSYLTLDFRFGQNYHSLFTRGKTDSRRSILLLAYSAAVSKQESPRRPAIKALRFIRINTSLQTCPYMLKVQLQ